MEKSRHSSELASYIEFEGLREDNLIVNTGYGFTGGISLGLLYNLCKFKSGGIKQKLIPNVVRVGGFGALFSLSIELSRLAVGHLRGTPGKENLLDMSTCTAASAALMWSPRGLRSASLAAFVAAGLAGTIIRCGRAESSISEINTYTYSYPHYNFPLKNSLETFIVRRFD